MKKIIITLAVIIASMMTLSARPTGLNLGGGIGYNAFQASSPASEYVDYIGAYAEVGYDFRLAKNCYIYSGVRYLEAFRTDDYANSLTRTGDVQIPIFYQQNFPVGKKKSKLYLEAGPTLDFWTVWMDHTYVGNKVVTTNLFDRTAVNRFNVYVGGNFGIKIQNHVKIYIGGDYGLVNILQAGNAHRWQLHLGAAYVF